MGLFDFLKNKPGETPATPATPSGTGTPAARPAADGPRYQGAKFTAPPEPGIPMMPTDFMPPQPEPFPFEPENVLEQLLLLAATDENARPAFYQALLQEEILMILAPAEGIEPGEVVLAEGQEIQLQILSDGKLPIFSSPSRLTDGGVETSPILPKDELAALLNGQLTGPLSPAGGDAQVLLSQPAEYPSAVAEAIAAWAATQEHIETAFLAQMQLEANPDVPRLLLAFESTSLDPSFMQELGPVLEGRATGFQFVDLMLLDKTSDEGVNPYFRTIEPFYKAG